MDLSVVIPVHNEQHSLRGLLQEIHGALTAQVDYEVVVVDDGSSDASLETLRDMQPEFPNLRVLHHWRNCGQSAAIFTGVQAARAPWIATLDGDGQNDPADILRLYRLLMEAQEPRTSRAVMGFRRRRHDNGWKRFTSRIANAVRGYLLQDHTPDTGCGLKVFTREAFLQLPYFDHMHRFLPALLQRQGVRVLSVAVRHRPRAAGVSHYGVRNRLWVGMVDLLGVWWLLRRNTRPVIDSED